MFKEINEYNMWISILCISLWYAYIDFYTVDIECWKAIFIGILIVLAALYATEKVIEFYKRR